MKFPFNTILALSTSFIPWTIGLPSPDTLPSNSPLFDISPFAPSPRDLPKTNFVNRDLEPSPRQATTARITNIISVSSTGSPNNQSILFFISGSGAKIAVFFINFNAWITWKFAMQITSHQYISPSTQPPAPSFSAASNPLYSHALDTIYPISQQEAVWRVSRTAELDLRTAGQTESR